MNKRGIYLGRYTYAKELANGEWTLYEGGYGDRAIDHTIGLEVIRKDGKPIRFTSFSCLFIYYTRK